MEYDYVEDNGFVLNPETTEESLASNITMAFIASILAVPGIVSADKLSRNISGTPTISQFQDAVKKANEKAPTFGGYSSTDAANLIARTIFAEAAGESLEGKKMVATVIWNRAGGDPQKLVKVCLAPSQFSCWNEVARSTLRPGIYTIRIPSNILNPKVRKAWDECQTLASELMNKTFVSLGIYNAYLNPLTADKSALDTWGTTMSNKKDVGKHRFGYLREKDPNRKSFKKATTFPSAYKVQKGDTLGKIAQRLMRDRKTGFTDARKLTARLVAVNNLKDNGNRIFIGQVLKLPQGVE